MAQYGNLNFSQHSHKNNNHFISEPDLFSYEVILYVLFFLLPTGQNLNFNRDHFTSDIGVEELGHLEMIGAIVYQLTRNLSYDEIKKSGFDVYFVDHTTGVYPTAASGFPYTAASMQSKGDLVADLMEDLAADATTAKEQPTISNARKPLILLAFRHFESFRKNDIPATI